MPGRSPALTAMTAATIDELSGGRMVLGIGSSGPQVAEGWHGQRFGRQLQRTREYVAVVRKALARERLEFKGETLELPLPDGPGKALKLMISPVQERIPIYLAAIGPKNTALAGEIADGWIPTFFSPEHVASFRELLEEGAARVGPLARRIRHRPDGPGLRVRRPRSRPQPDASRCSRSTSAGWARASRTSTTTSSSATGSRRPQARSRICISAARRPRRPRRFPAELIDAVSLCGPRDVVRDRLAAFRDAGVGTLMVSPMAWTTEDRVAQLRAVAELAA